MPCHSLLLILTSGVERKAPLSKKLLQSYSLAPLCLNTRPQSLILGAEAERENIARRFPRYVEGVWGVMGKRKAEGGHE